MKKFIALILLFVFTNLSMPVFAKSITVKNSTRVPITFEQQYTSKQVFAGQKIDGVIADDVKIQNQVVFKKGDRAFLNVSDVKKAGFIGNAGELYLVNGAVMDVNGDVHTVEFNKKFIGKEKTYPKVLLGVSIFFLFPLALFGFVKGGQAKVNTGEIIDVYLRNDFVISI